MEERKILEKLSFSSFSLIIALITEMRWLWKRRRRSESKWNRDTHKWLVFSALRRCQWPSRLSSLLRNQSRWIDPWRNAIIGLWREHRGHEGTSVLSWHHVRCSLLRCIRILLRQELLLGCHRRHCLVGQMLPICRVCKSRILRSQQLLEEEKRKINKMQFEW